MKSMNMYLIGIGPDKGEQPPAHSNGARIRIGKTEDILWENVGVQKDLPDTGGQDLGFTRTGSGDDHNGAFGGLDGQALLLIQFLVFLLEMLLEFLPVD